MNARSRLPAFGAAALSAILLSACAAARRAPVARVAQRAITQAELAHWMKVQAPEHLVPDPPAYSSCIAQREQSAPQTEVTLVKAECRQEYAALRQQALSSLISRAWVIGEAGARHLSVSAQEVARELQVRERSAPNGEREFQEWLKTSGHTLDDVRLEIQAQIAAEKLRQAVQRGAPRVSAFQIARYYSSHIARFETRERRDAELVEGLKSRPVAVKLMREVQHGRSISPISLHESLEKPPPSGETLVYRTIFKATPDVVSAPVPVGNDYFYVIEVTRVIPASREPLAKASATIQRQLNGESARRALARFIAGWRNRWIARTDCARGYVVQKCRQYRGQEASEDPLAFS